MNGPADIPEELIECLRAARRVAALTGAGISAESGIPTFRDAQTGLWAQYRAEDLATPEAFRRDPRLVWNWYQWRRHLVDAAAPNPGHIALVEMADRIADFTLITQNVDGMHTRAGSRNVISLHGDIQRTKCSRDGRSIDSWPESDEIPPPCPECRAPLRPDVVWFGEMLDEGVLQAAFAAASRCEIFLSIGTSALVQPAAALPLEALRSGATVVEINPEHTPLSASATYSLRGAAGEILPGLLARISHQDRG